MQEKMKINSKLEVGTWDMQDRIRKDDAQYVCEVESEPLIGTHFLLLDSSLVGFGWKNDDQYLNDDPPTNSRRKEVGGISFSGMDSK